MKSDKQNPTVYPQLWATIMRGETGMANSLIGGRAVVSTLRSSISPRWGGGAGEITHFIATKQDVTERKSLEAQLRQATKVEAIGRLAGGVAHDFNNLLTIINGYSALLMEKLEADKQASAYLKEIKDAGERAASLTRQLLAFSRRQVLAPVLVRHLKSCVGSPPRHFGGHFHVPCPTRQAWPLDRTARGY